MPNRDNFVPILPVHKLRQFAFYELLIKQGIPGFIKKNKNHVLNLCIFILVRASISTRLKHF